MTRLLAMFAFVPLLLGSHVCGHGQPEHPADVICENRGGNTYIGFFPGHGDPTMPGAVDQDVWQCNDPELPLYPDEGIFVVLEPFGGPFDLPPDPPYQPPIEEISQEMQDAAIRSCGAFGGQIGIIGAEIGFPPGTANQFRKIIYCATQRILIEAPDAP